MLVQTLSAQTSNPVDIALEPVVTGVLNPVAIAHAGDGSGRLFITQQGGQILIHDGTEHLTMPFLDISALVSSDGERGLLSVAFHPNYATNGFFYVDYTDLNGDTVIARYQVSSNPNVAETSSATSLLIVDQPFANHNGGQLQFGPDGLLYIGMGDGGSGGDPGNRAQDLSELLGKMLRIDVDPAFLYAIPPTNPFVGTPGARGEIWALGLRNPWRFSFDRSTGDLLIADVGQDNREEVDFQAAASPGGENYGWRLMEGSVCFSPSTNCNDGTLILPILEYDHSAGDCSITGGHRYRGSRFPQLAGTYFYADFCTGRIWGATQKSDGSWTARLLLDTDFLISTFGEDEDGEIYVADWLDGAVYRILVSNTAAPTIASLSPNSTTGGGPSLALRVTGSNFVPSSIVRWNGLDRSTFFLDHSQLEASIPASDTANGGIADVTVFNPPPGGGTSNTLTLVVSDFAIDVSPGTTTVSQGESASYTVTLTPRFGSFDRSISLDCANLPASTSCSFSAAFVTPGSNQATVTLTVSTASPSALLAPPFSDLSQFPIWAVGVGIIALALPSLLLADTKRAFRCSVTSIVLLILLALLVACGSTNSPPLGLSGTQIGSHTITVVGTSRSLQRSVMITLVVR